jgi:hypothetical protein
VVRERLHVAVVFGERAPARARRRRRAAASSPRRRRTRDRRRVPRRRPARCGSRRAARTRARPRSASRRRARTRPGDGRAAGGAREVGSTCLPQSRWLPSRACRHSTAVTSPRARRSSHSSTTRCDAPGSRAASARTAPGARGSAWTARRPLRAEHRDVLDLAHVELARVEGALASWRGSGPVGGRRGRRGLRPARVSGRRSPARSPRSRPPTACAASRSVTVVSSSLGAKLGRRGSRARSRIARRRSRASAGSTRGESRAAPRRWRAPARAGIPLPRCGMWRGVTSCSSRRTTSRGATSGRTSATSPRCWPRSGSARSTS